MDNDRGLRLELRRALDEVLPPTPWLESAVSDDLRKRISRQSTGGRQAKPAQREVARRRGPMQLAAALIIALIAIAAVGTFLVLQHTASLTSPAGLNVSQYMAMTARDNKRFDSAGVGGTCSSLTATCPAPGRPVQTSLRLWLDDLNRSRPPAEFSLIDAQLRRHVAAGISDLDATFAAYAARDAAGLDRANYVFSRESVWIDDVAGSVVQAQPSSAAAYIQQVRAQYQGFAGCAACLRLVTATQADCSGLQTSSCYYDVSLEMSLIEPFEALLVRYRAPTTLAAQDAALQRDLATADAGLLRMESANLSGDRVAFDTGMQMLGRALPAIDADVAVILGA